ncbi:hypothetical protein ONE63_005131 [Megalurothrips usitatus]|uniref:Transposase domain-containing protein n=1 Tax=Megalurothrips usitatus TaxID=439358 RepID=A0AAV7Y1S4_9NEOP|nr:hypothetical protein ONE63_005131 [Megalurothrips usitatus]
MEGLKEQPHQVLVTKETSSPEVDTSADGRPEGTTPSSSRDQDEAESAGCFNMGTEVFQEAEETYYDAYEEHDHAIHLLAHPHDELEPEPEQEPEIPSVAIPHESPQLYEVQNRKVRTKLNDPLTPVYKSFVENGGILSHWQNISITIATDGSPIFESACNTMYPVQSRINEFPLNIRFDTRNCMVVAVWFGKHDPEMTALLQPVVEEIKRLYETGFKWNHQGEIVTTRVVPLNSVLDSVCKPKVQQMSQFYGYYGCNYCEHPGVKIPEHPQPRYIVPDTEENCVMNENFECEYSVEWEDPKTHDTEEVNVKDRSNRHIRRVMKNIQRGNARPPVKGVVGCSPLIPLLMFNLVFGFCVDYMHAVLLGVCKLVTTLQVQTKSNGLPFYLGNKIHLVNQRMAKIAPPSSISRRPRSLNKIHLWKANEWRAYLLYYSLSCLVGILPVNYVKHHSLLVSAIYILLQDKITIDELKQAALYLRTYVIDFQRLYGEVHMNFNVHLLLHIRRCTKMFGPIFTFLAFCFESGNGNLVKLVKGTRFGVSQIARKYSSYSCIPEIVSLYTVSPQAIDFCDELLSFTRSKMSIKVGSVTLLGDMKRIPLSDEEEAAFCAANL